ncbi:hypothetical protein AcW1_000892 [Taiwanofungus camphoratus]|nr:hypothetical protein AcW1_000892 [Antrodia cinnamomea]
MSQQHPSLPSVLPSAPALQDVTTTPEQLQSGLARVTNPAEYVILRLSSLAHRPARTQDTHIHLRNQQLLQALPLQRPPHAPPQARPQLGRPGRRHHLERVTDPCVCFTCQLHLCVLGMVTTDSCLLSFTVLQQFLRGAIITNP